MPRLEITDTAVDNIRDLASYIALQSGSREAAERFATLIFDRCERLASLPGTMGRARPELRADIRSIAFKSYVIFFRYQEDVLEIVNVLEGHRDIDAYFDEG